MYPTHPNEKGGILVLFAVCLTLFFMFLAMAVDYGLIFLAKSELQAAADSAALAGAAQLADEDYLVGTPNLANDLTAARDYSEEFAAYNTVIKENLVLERNEENMENGGIVIGFLDNPMDLQDTLETQNQTHYNTVQVTTRRTTAVNGPIQMLLGAFTGLQEVSVESRASATLDDRVIGFDAPEGETVGILPFTMYKHAWDCVYNPSYVQISELCPAQNGEDHYAYVGGEVIKNQGDRIPEVKLYPNKAGICEFPDAPGNFGTVDIGLNNNSTDDLCRQIRYGLNHADLRALDGMVMEQGLDGKFRKLLQGDTGVSNAVKEALEAIKGKPRVLPVYDSLSDPGNNCIYEIVGFVGVRVMDVKMTGALEDRHVVVQPCFVTDSRAIIHPDAPHSNFVFSLSLTR
ncbi:MAG TPA: pilus assembly protein [bacterium]|nr:pilus assembly protein [bacterium]